MGASAIVRESLTILRMARKSKSSSSMENCSLGRLMVSLVATLPVPRRMARKSF